MIKDINFGGGWGGWDGPRRQWWELIENNKICFYIFTKTFFNILFDVEKYEQCLGKPKSADLIENNNNDINVLTCFSIIKMSTISGLLHIM